MVVSRKGRKTRFQRHLANSPADGVDFAAIRETKTTFPRGQTAKQTNEPGGKKSKADRDPNRHPALHDQLPPQEGEHDEVSPDSYFQIVTNPRRRFEREKENKDGGGCENKGDLFRQLFFPAESTILDAGC